MVNRSGSLIGCVNAGDCHSLGDFLRSGNGDGMLQDESQEQTQEEYFVTTSYLFLFGDDALLWNAHRLLLNNRSRNTNFSFLLNDLRNHNGFVDLVFLRDLNNLDHLMMGPKLVEG